MAHCRSSNRGYSAKQFYLVSHCDFESIDDPCSSKHLTSIHMVEIRRRTDVWKTMVIWCISVINGCQRKINEIDFKYKFNQQQQLASLFSEAPWCRESKGVVVVCLKDHLCIFDTLYEQPVVHNIAQVRRSRNTPLIQCIRRIRSSDRKCAGWLIRVIAASRELYQENFLFCLTTRIYNIPMRGRPQVISEQDMVFGTADDEMCHVHRIIRTSKGVGLAYDANGTFQAMIYDVRKNQWRYWSNFTNLLQGDVPFDRFHRLSRYPTPHSPRLFPPYLSRQECITSNRAGYVYRIGLEPPTLKYRANPNLTWMISADQFRMVTGIGGMEAHFVRKR